MKKKSLLFTVVILILGLGTGVVHVFLMPPFQNPDEIQHFLYSASYAYSPQQMERVEDEVLKLLKKHRWFHFVGIGPGWENIQKISDISFVFNFDTERFSARKTFFHFWYGKVLRLSGIKDVLTAFYFLRLLSTLFFIIILLMVFWFFYTYYPEKWIYYFAGVVLVFQLVTILNAINYDVFLVLWGGGFFIAAHRFHFTQKKTFLIVLLITALLATLTKLVGIIFFVYLLILLSLKVTWNLKLIRHFSVMLLLVFLGYCWMNYFFPERFFNLYSVIFGVLKDFSGTITGERQGMLRFGLFNSMFDSFYFQTGWMGFKIKNFWYWGLKLFFLFSLCGIGLSFFIQKIKASIQEKKWFIFSLIVCALHVLSIWLYYGGRLSVQGRYLYPLIIPIILLIYSGLLYLQKFFHLKKDYLLTMYILFQMVLTLFAVTKIISVFYLEMASPHGGL